jgi:hypothetical protein
MNVMFGFYVVGLRMMRGVIDLLGSGRCSLLVMGCCVVVDSHYSECIVLYRLHPPYSTLPQARRVKMFGVSKVEVCGSWIVGLLLPRNRQYQYYTYCY